jgi:hypothetical protein
MFKQTPNQARGKVRPLPRASSRLDLRSVHATLPCTLQTIADKYAKNARGVVTGASRNAFALGQAVSPVVSGALYNVDPCLPYAVGSVLIACNVVFFALSGVPFFHDDTQETAAATSVKQAPPGSTPGTRRV